MEITSCSIADRRFAAIHRLVETHSIRSWSRAVRSRKRIRQEKPANLDVLVLTRRPDMETFHTRSWLRTCDHAAQLCTFSAVKKVHLEPLIRAPPSDHIIPRLQCQVPVQHQRRLHKQKVRILSIRCISGSDQHNRGNHLVVRVDDAVRSAHLRFDVLLFYSRTSRQRRLKLDRGCRSPSLASGRLSARSNGQPHPKQHPTCPSHSRSPHCGRCTIPRCSARTAACVRSDAPSFPSRLFTCDFTVASEICRSLAISLFARPATIRSSTSNSRELSSSLPTRCASFSAITGGMRPRPAFTARIASTSSSISMPFSR